MDKQVENRIGIIYYLMLMNNSFFSYIYLWENGIKEFKNTIKKFFSQCMSCSTALKKKQSTQKTISHILQMYYVSKLIQMTLMFNVT